jgi:hypothetical protein
MERIVVCTRTAAIDIYFSQVMALSIRKEFVKGYMTGWCLVNPSTSASEADEAEWDCAQGPDSAGYFDFSSNTVTRYTSMPIKPGVRPITDHNIYNVIASRSGLICSCRDYNCRDAKCKHVYAVEFYRRISPRF